jgi:diguanylate cyclase (GGDEF)-like protein/PAS domain S-box-containing protein
MQSLHTLSRDELIALVGALELRLAQSAEPANAARVEQDFVCRQTLAAFDEAKVAALVYDDGNDLPILAANACMAELSGFPLEELEGTPLIELVMPEEVERVRRMLRLSRYSGFARAGRWRHRTRAGEVREVEAGGYELTFAGRRARLLVVQDAVPHRREQITRQRLASIVEMSQDAIFSRTIDGTILSWNRAAEQLLGHRASDIIGHSVELLMPPELRQREMERIRSHVLNGQALDGIDSLAVSRSGERIEVRMTVAPLVDPDGSIVGASTMIRDLRELKRTQRELALARTRLDHLTGAAAIWCWEQDENLRFTWHSPDSAAGGQSPADGAALGHVLGRTRFELPIVWRSEQQKADHARALQLHEPFHDLEIAVVDAAQRERQLSVSGQPLFDASGAFRGYRGITRDIGEQRRITQLERMLTALLDSTDSLVIARSLEGEMLYWNRGAERALGYSAAEIVGRSCMAIIPEQRHPEAARLTRIARAGHRVPRLEVVRRNKRGQEVHLAVSVSPLRDQAGKVIGLAAIGRDVTDRVLAERRLRESEERLRTLVENSTDAVWITDARGQVSVPLPSWQRYTGQTFEQAQGLGWLDAVHPDERADVGARWQACVRSGAVFESEQRMRRADGQWRYVAARGTPVRNGDGSVREWFGMLSDVTERRGAEAARSLLAAVVQSSQDAIISHDFEGRILSWNRGAREVFGYSQDEIVGCDFRVLLADPESVPLEAIRERILRGERVAPYELAARHRDGREVPVSVSQAGLRAQHGEIVGITAVVHDISAQRAAQRALRESERQLESILNNVAEGMIVLSARGGIERINLFAQRMFACDAEDARHLNLRQLVVELRHDDSVDEDAPGQWVRRLMGARRELTGRRLDGSVFPLELSISEIALAPGAPKFTAVARDITERKNWESRIYSLAYSDPLTGLPNRLLLRDRLEHAIAAAQRNRSLVGVLFFDLDYFKAVNDAYGHHIGDHLLREIAERAKSCVREIDTVSRLGGDEFVLVLPELREAGDAGAVARKILAALSQPYAIDGRELRITPTVGISIYPHHGGDADSLLRNADSAMYHAKEGGKNSFRFYGTEASPGA